jgi:hypothetical protein
MLPQELKKAPDSGAFFEGGIAEKLIAFGAGQVT